MKVDDLTIYLRAVDQTKRAFGKLERRLGKIGKLAKVAGGLIAGIGVSAVTAFSKGVEHGRQFFTELKTMERLLNLNTKEADGLVQVIRQFAPGAEVEKLQEALLTLEEGFFDAHAASGPLNDLIKDFGVNLNLDQNGAQDQLVEFLRALRQIPNEADRVGAAIANLGADDAKPFIALSRNVESLDRAIELLSGNINDIPNIVDDDDVAKVEEYNKSVEDLNGAWERFSKEAFLTSSESLSGINRLMTRSLDISTQLIASLKEAFSFGDLIAADDGIDAKVKEIGDSLDRKSLPLVNKLREFFGLEALLEPGGTPGPVPLGEAGVLASIDSFGSNVAPDVPAAAGSSGRASASSATTEAVDKKLSQLEQATLYAERVREGITSAADLRDLRLLEEIEGVHERFSLNYPEEATSAAELRSAQLERERKQYEDIGSTLGSLGSAFSSLAEISGKGSEKTFKTFQRLQVAISAAAAISAAVQTLADPSLGFFGKIAAYGKILAIGLGAVAQLKSLNSSSSGASGGSASAGGGALPNTAPQGVEQQAGGGNQGGDRRIEVNIQGGIFNADTVEELLNVINDLDLGVKINSNRIAA